MTRQSRKKLEYTMATHAIERLIPSKDALSICEQMADGVLSADAAISSILERYGLVRGNAHG